jgi:hypothetical protein
MNINSFQHRICFSMYSYPITNETSHVTTHATHSDPWPGFVFFWCLVYPMLPMSLDCPFLIATSVFSNVYLSIFHQLTLSEWWLHHVSFVNYFVLVVKIAEMRLLLDIKQQRINRCKKNAKYHNTPTALAKEKCRRTAEESRTTRTQPKVWLLIVIRNISELLDRTYHT